MQKSHILGFLLIHQEVDIFKILIVYFTNTIKCICKGTYNSSFFCIFAANIMILYEIRRYEGIID